MSPLSSQFDPRMPTCLTIVLSRGTRLPRGIAIQDERRAPARHRMRISSHSNEACFDVVFRALAEVGPTRLALAGQSLHLGASWRMGGPICRAIPVRGWSQPSGRQKSKCGHVDLRWWIGIHQGSPRCPLRQGPTCALNHQPPCPPRGRTDPRERKATSSKPSLSPVFGNPHHSHFFSNGPSFSLQTD